MFESISIALRPFHIIHIPPSPRNVVWVTQEHLMAHWCQAMAHFELGCVKKWHLNAKSGQNLTQFKVCLTAYLLLSDYFISSIHPQGMLLGLPKSI
jgi:hypothetical protein